MVVSNEISYQKASEVINAYNLLQKNQSNSTNLRHNNPKTKIELSQDVGNSKEINIKIVNKLLTKC